MMRAGRMAAGWLAGRAVLFLLALGVLVAAEISTDPASRLRSRIAASLPDARLVAELERRRFEAWTEADARRTELNARLGQAHELPPDELARWLGQLDREIARREDRRLDGLDLALAASQPEVLVGHARNEAALQVLRWTRSEVLRVLRGVANLRMTPPEAEAALAQARARQAANSATYWQARRASQSFARGHPLAAHIPFEVLGLQDEDRQRFLVLQRDLQRAAVGVIASRKTLTDAERAREQVRQARATVARPLSEVDGQAMQALDSVIAARRRSVDAVERGLAETMDRGRKLAWTAFWIVVLLSAMPVLLKAFWYYVMAPLAARRPPIRIAPDAQPVLLSRSPAEASKMSSVTLDLRLGADEELLVHPEFLQSLAQPGDKRTRWLLDAGYPLMSFASGMVALTRIRGAGHSYAVSSRKDPFAEVGVIDLPVGGQFVLQPRHLVGIVQHFERPVRLRSRWRFGLGAWITLQFRFLVFHGPGRLIVSGCRGVRQEVAGQGRSVDQAATIGFSANLDYVPRRSPTFGAYLLGVNGLFDDGFEGGPGVYVYEEMPYYGKRSGLTGRGLEGVADVVLRAFGL